MGGDGRRGAAASVPVWAYASGFLCLLLPARVAVAADYGTGLAGAVLAATAFVLPVLYTVPRGRAVWDRHRGWLLAAQAVLTYVPFVVFGERWVVGLSGLLGGLVLLTVAARVSWLLFGLILAVEAVLRIVILGVYPDANTATVAWVFIVPADMALTLFGLVRLTDLVTQLRVTRNELAVLAVDRERRLAAGRLRTAVGGRLEPVMAHARAALALLPQAPDEARSHLVDAAGIARQVQEQVRTVAAAEQQDRRPAAVDASAPALAPRLARLILIAVLGLFAVQLATNVFLASAGVVAKTAGTAAVVAVAALQFYHSLASSAGARPPAWRVTLPLQALLPFLGWWATRELNTAVFAMAAFPAASALLLLTGRWAWLGYGTITAGVAVVTLLIDPDYAYSSYLTALVAAFGVAVYGLSRLVDIAADVQATRAELARMAVAQERLSVAKDIHDLLGLGLAAVALKCDLVVRLLGRDDARARRELEHLLDIVGKAAAEVRTVTDQDHRLSLDAELASAREVLGSAGVDVRTDVAQGPVPAEMATVLATVLREAVTNVVRHAAARRCTIELSTGPDAVRLCITNDGVTGDGGSLSRTDDPDHRGGRGLANLAERAGAIGGHLTATSAGGRFELTIELPLRAQAPVDVPGSGRPDVDVQT